MCNSGKISVTGENVQYVVTRLSFAQRYSTGSSSCQRVAGSAPASLSHTGQGLSSASDGLQQHSIHPHSFDQRSTVAQMAQDTWRD